MTQFTGGDPLLKRLADVEQLLEKVKATSLTETQINLITAYKTNSKQQFIRELAHLLSYSQATLRTLKEEDVQPSQIEHHGNTRKELKRLRSLRQFRSRTPSRAGSRMTSNFYLSSRSSRMSRTSHSNSSLSMSHFSRKARQPRDRKRLGRVAMIDEEGNNILHICAQRGESELIRIITSYEAAKDLLLQQNDDGFTPLMIACGYGTVECVNALLCFSPKQSQRNNVFRTFKTEKKAVAELSSEDDNQYYVHDFMNPNVYPELKPTQMTEEISGLESFKYLPPSVPTTNNSLKPRLQQRMKKGFYLSKLDHGPSSQSIRTLASRTRLDSSLKSINLGDSRFQSDMEVETQSGDVSDTLEPDQTQVDRQDGELENSDLEALFGSERQSSLTGASQSRLESKQQLTSLPGIEATAPPSFTNADDYGIHLSWQEFRAYLDMTCSTGDSAVNICLIKSRLELAKLLLKQRASGAVIGKGNLTSLHYLSSISVTDGSNFGEKEQIEKLEKQVLELLLRQEADMYQFTSKTIESAGNNDGENTRRHDSRTGYVLSCVHICISYNRLHMFKALVSKNQSLVNIHSIEKRETPLFICCQKKYFMRDEHASRVPFVQLLIENGANINHESKLYQYTPLMTCLLERHRTEDTLRIAKLLLEENCDVTKVGTDSFQALTIAIYFLDLEAIKALLESPHKAHHKYLDLSKQFGAQGYAFDYALKRYKAMHGRGVRGGLFGHRRNQRLPLQGNRPGEEPGSERFIILKLLRNHGACSQYSYNPGDAAPTNEVPKFFVQLVQAAKGTDFIERLKIKYYTFCSTSFDYLGRLPFTVLSLCVIFDFPELVSYCLEKASNTPLIRLPTLKLRIKPRLCVLEELSKKTTSAHSSNTNDKDYFLSDLPHRVETFECYCDYTLSTQLSWCAKVCCSCGFVFQYGDTRGGSVCSVESLTHTQQLFRKCSTLLCEACTYFIPSKQGDTAASLATRKGNQQVIDIFNFADTEVAKVLRKAEMTKYIAFFRAANIKTLALLQKLTTEQLLAMGISDSVDREALVNAAIAN